MYQDNFMTTTWQVQTDLNENDIYYFVYRLYSLAQIGRAHV